MFSRFIDFYKFICENCDTEVGEVTVLDTDKVKFEQYFYRKGEGIDLSEFISNHKLVEKLEQFRKEKSDKNKNIRVNIYKELEKHKFAFLNCWDCDLEQRYEELKNIYAGLVKDYVDLLGWYDIVVNESSNLANGSTDLEKVYFELVKKIDILTSKHDDLAKKFIVLANEYDDLENKCIDLINEYRDAMNRHSGLAKECIDLVNKCHNTELIYIYLLNDCDFKTREIYFLADTYCFVVENHSKAFYMVKWIIKKCIYV